MSYKSVIGWGIVLFGISLAPLSIALVKEERRPSYFKKGECCRRFGDPYGEVNIQEFNIHIFPLSNLDAHK